MNDVGEVDENQFFYYNFICKLYVFKHCWSFETFVEGPDKERITLIEKNEEIGHYTLEISGFEPGEKIKTISKSKNEVVKGEFIFPSSGNQVVMLLPAVIGYCQGEASLTVIGAKKKTLTFNYNWKVSPKYAFGN